MKTRIQAMVLATAFWLPQATLGQASTSAPRSEGELFHIFNRADSVLRVTVHATDQNPSESNRRDAGYTARLTFTEEVPIKGERPGLDRFVIPPDVPFPSGLASGEQLLIASTREFHQPKHRVDAFERASVETVALFERATSVPFGWNLQHGSPVSPWTLPKHASFELGHSMPRYTACAVSGRPSLLTPPEIRLEASAILPEERTTGINPYGDGMFSVKVTNTGVTTQRVDSLRQRDGIILWNESLVVDCLGAAYVFAQSGSIDNTQPVRLGPGDTVQGTIDLMTLRRLLWPAKSGVVPLRLGLGNTVIRLRFHYHPHHHGKRIR